MAKIESHPSGATPNSTQIHGPVWAVLIATFFGVGRINPGPGTWGSLAAAVLWSVAGSQIPSGKQSWATVVAAGVITLVGIPAATRVARANATKDPQFVVIDEVAGQLVTLIGAPLGWKTALTGFILFRVFDILKPFPVRRLESLPEGSGIVVDDLGAGIYAVAVMHLLMHFGLLIK
jgi:phosphatidylglycerophosphatase A